MIDVIVVGTREYFWALRAFAELFNRYWGPVPVTHFGDVECVDLLPNFKSQRVPCFQEGQWPWDHHFSRGLASCLETLTGDLVAIFLPDHWLSEPVDQDAVQVVADFMRDTGKVLRGNLAAGTCLESYGHVVKRGLDWDVVVVAPTDHHCSFGGGLTFCPSLWDRAALIRFLEPHWTLWECEKVGTEKFARTLWKDGWVSCGTRPAALWRCHGLSHAAPRAANLSGLSPEDREVVRRYLPAGWEVLT